MGKLLSVVALIVIGIVGMIGFRRGEPPIDLPGVAGAPTMEHFLTFAEEQGAITLLAREWPTAATVKVLNLSTVWLSDNQRVVHAVFDAQNLSGATVREKQLLAFEFADGGITYDRKAWHAPSSMSPTGAEVDALLIANRWMPTELERLEMQDAAAKAAASKRVVGTETVDGISYHIHDDGTRTLVR